MKILKIIHGYPPIYNAGSEVYSQLLCHGLYHQGHEIGVFTREENSFRPDYEFRETVDSVCSDIKLHLINIPRERHRYRYHHQPVDSACNRVIDNFKPDVVHIGHLNHLSLTLVGGIANRNIPMVYTIHDFWLLCPRGQFIQRNPSSNKDVWSLCNGQENRKCAKNCYAGYFSGLPSETNIDERYWTYWVEKRMATVRSIIDKIDLFIAPSKKLMHRYCKEFNAINNKIKYMDYGFNLNRLSGRRRKNESHFVFGYIGTHIPAKGIDLLIRAFANLSDHRNIILRIWGRTNGQDTEGLKRFISGLDSSIRSRIEWLPEYKNDYIVESVFNHVDVIVVPSIWQENSPLVIHEALQSRVGIITADFGGMSEYVKHEENGWLFEHRNYHSLTKIMQTVSGLNQNELQKISQRGYLASSTGDVINIDKQAQDFESIYAELIERKKYVQH